VQGSPAAARQADHAQRVARARRMAWGLALVVIACYVGFIVMTGARGPN